jgi:hypothetical protein
VKVRPDLGYNNTIKNQFGKIKARVKKVYYKTLAFY